MANKNLVIDIVYTWVNNKDLNWQKKKEEAYRKFDKSLITKNSVTKGRFENHDELKLSLRSIEKYMSWVRKIFIVTDNQVPEWIDLNNKKIKIISHSQLLPRWIKKPIFNSVLIEWFLNRIPNLSEYFIYFNDDFFVGKKIKKEDFYQDKKHTFITLGKPQKIFKKNFSKLSKEKIYELIKEKSNNYTFESIPFLENTAEIIKKIYSEDYLKLFPKHAPYPFKKSLFSKVYNLFSSYIKEYMANSQFRTKYDIYITPLYVAYYYDKGLVNVDSSKYSLFDFGCGSKYYNQKKEDALNFLDKRYKFLSLQLGEYFKKDWLDFALNILKIRFNKISKFEKEYKQQKFIKLLKNKILYLEKELALKNKIIEEQQNHLNKIYSGRVWKIALFYFKLRDKLIFYLKDYKKMILLLRKIKNRIFSLGLTFFYKKYLKQFNPELIFLPSIDWNTPLFQRPQHLSLNLSQKIKILYCTYNHLYDNIQGLKKINKNLIITNAWEELINIYKDKFFLITSTQNLLTNEFLLRIKKNSGKIIYDYIDTIDEKIVGDTSLIFKRHLFIKKTKIADYVICSSKKLYEEMIKNYPKNKVLLVPNGVDFNHFQVKKNIKKVDNYYKAIINQGKPIIGYYGAIAPWLDYQLINAVAYKNKNLNFVFIGIDYNGSLKKLNLGLENLYFLGEKNYLTELPYYAIFFDVAIIPFKKGEIAKHTSPLKLYEYMALGKPVIATEDLYECYGYKGVIISKNNAQDFSKKIYEALLLKNDKNIIENLKLSANLNSWKNRANIIYEKIFKKNI